VPSAQGGEIAKSYDENLTTMYHSKGNGETTFPVTLTYNLTDATIVDYINYYPRTYPRTSGVDGAFKTFEIYVSYNNGSPVKYGDYDFEGSYSPTQITFDPPLINPTAIQFKVLSGEGNSVGCSEMEFYRKDPTKFDHTALFTGASCSELRPEVTSATIENIRSAFYKDIATRLLNNTYPKEFRIQSYRAWGNSDVEASVHKNSWPYSQLDNPTGIYTDLNADLVVLVDDTYGRNISLAIQDIQDISAAHVLPNQRVSFSLKKGENKIKATRKGLIYIMYNVQENLDDGHVPEVKIHITGGKVNGYFDSQKHEASDWNRLLNAAVHTDFEVLGKYAHLTFPTEKFRTNTGNDGKALIDAWDRIVFLEHELMGIHKHNRKFHNRVYCNGDWRPGTSWMYAFSYHTGYHLDAVAPLLKPSTLTTSSIWGPAHEIGHLNQLSPWLKWVGMTEVTNNILSLYVQTEFGNVSRLQTENVYSNGWSRVVIPNEMSPSPVVAHNGTALDGTNITVWQQLVPFWQLYLYFQKAGRRPDFYQDLYENYRTSQTSPPGSTEGRYQLEFVRRVCNVSQINMLEFFEKWGFLTPIDRAISDYGNQQFTITQAQITALKAEINAKPYASIKPAKDVTRITDNNVNEYR
jgi:hypothetical protein